MAIFYAIKKIRFRKLNLSLIGKTACGIKIASSHQLCFIMTLGKKILKEEEARKIFSTSCVA